MDVRTTLIMSVFLMMCKLLNVSDISWLIVFLPMIGYWGMILSITIWVLAMGYTAEDLSAMTKVMKERGRR